MESQIKGTKYDYEKRSDGLVNIVGIEQKDWQHNSLRTGLLGIKKGMIRIWDDWGVSMPCTVLQV